MRRILWSALLGVCLFTRLSFSGPPAAGAKARYERIICVVPLVGTGSYADPRRPLFTPAPGRSLAEQPSSAVKTLGFLNAAQILGYSSLMADDGQHAIVEFVARDRVAFRPMLGADPGTVQVFERGRWTGPALVQELRKQKKNFTLEMLEVGVQ